MSTYRWHADSLLHVTALPAAVADRLLVATPEQLRVLVWFSAHTANFDAAACAAALKMPADACQSCLRFWVEQNVLVNVEESAVAPSVSSAGTAIPRPTPVKPRAQEVLRYQKQHPDFAAFVEAASARLGKAIGHGDTATLLYLLDTVGLPQEVILLEIAYAVSIGKGNMRYIEKLALDWADKELTALPDVDRHIQYLERCHRAAERIQQLFLLPRALNVSQAEMCAKWLDDWHFTEPMLKAAYDITIENTGKFSPVYMDGILKRWQAEDIHTLDKITRPPAKKKSAAATNPEQSSLDIDSFDQALQRYRPQFGKKN
ncbi:MAG: DnaD domain protein [Clostridia bacterium]|nr:DnaD domain protein [Clostridia bacterium]